MSTYEIRPVDLTVTSLNIMDGLNIGRNWDALQQVWDSEGMGFLEFCMWIHDVSEQVNKELEKRNPQEFAGVFDYEVSCPLGEMILIYTGAAKRLPTVDELATWIKDLTDQFFARGEQK
jgi:hypothetical protein